MQIVSKSNKRYKNIFLVGSILTAGNTIEYFTEHTENLVVFYLLTTLRSKKDYIEIYKNAKLLKKMIIFTPRIPVIYYISVYCWYIYALFRYFPKSEKIFVISFHPLFFLLNSLIRRIRNIQIVFWVIDYLPSTNFLLTIYQKLIFHYHKNNMYSLYLGDRVNKIMNGKVMSTQNKKTVMWGVRSKKNISDKKRSNTFISLIGVIRPSHGLDIVFDLMKANKSIRMKVLGECNNELYSHYVLRMSKLGIQKQVEFKNKFYPEDVLSNELKGCVAGIALYNTDPKDPIYYTDPGKVKTYTEYGIPVIMTNTSEIAPYIRKYKAGRIISRNSTALEGAIIDIKKNYAIYARGVKAFNAYFNYQRYYQEKFNFMENKNV